MEKYIKVMLLNKNYKFKQMKKLIFLIMPMCLSAMYSYGQNIELMSYNIRLDNANDGENAWPNRKETFVNQILFYAPDVIGIQEGLEHQVSYLDTKLKTYKYVGVAGLMLKKKGQENILPFFIILPNIKS